MGHFQSLAESYPFQVCHVERFRSLVKEGLAAAVRLMGLESRIRNCRSLWAETAEPGVGSWTRTIAAAAAEVEAAVAAAEGSLTDTTMEAAVAEVVAEAALVAEVVAEVVREASS